jgi:excisionase family DNA binding protein
VALERHYSGREVAELLGVNYETVLQLAQTGELPSLRVGRLRRFSESAVKTYISRHQDGIVVDLTSRLRSPRGEE